MKKMIIKMMLLAVAVTAFSAAATVSAAGREEIAAVGIGSDRAAVGAAAGEAKSRSMLKESYILDDGSEAVAHFDGDILVRGFILAAGTENVGI